MMAHQTAVNPKPDLENKSGRPKPEYDPDGRQPSTAVENISAKPKTGNNADGRQTSSWLENFDGKPNTEKNADGRHTSTSLENFDGKRKTDKKDDGRQISTSDGEDKTMTHKSLAEAITIAIPMLMHGVSFLRNTNTITSEKLAMIVLSSIQLVGFLVMFLLSILAAYTNWDDVNFDTEETRIRRIRLRRINMSVLALAAILGMIQVLSTSVEAYTSGKNA